MNRKTLLVLLLTLSLIAGLRASLSTARTSAGEPAFKAKPRETFNVQSLMTPKKIGLAVVITVLVLVGIKYAVPPIRRMFKERQYDNVMLHALDGSSDERHSGHIQGSLASSQKNPPPDRPRPQRIQ